MPVHVISQSPVTLYTRIQLTRFVCLIHTCVVRLVVVCLFVCHADRNACKLSYIFTIHSQAFVIITLGIRYTPPVICTLPSYIRASNHQGRECVCAWLGGGGVQSPTCTMSNVSSIYWAKSLLTSSCYFKLASNCVMNQATALPSGGIRFVIPESSVCRSYLYTMQVGR